MTGSFTLNLKRNGTSNKLESTPFSKVPQRVLNIDFENSAIAPMTEWGTSSTLVVSGGYEGTKSLRMNLATYFGTNDPITGKPRNSSPINLDIKSLTGGSNRDWDKCYISYYMKFDDATNLDDLGNSTSPKLGYFSDITEWTSTETSCAIYPTLKAGYGISAFYENSTNNIIEHSDTDGSVYGSNAGCNFAYNGEWNHVEVAFDYVSGWMTIRINGCPFVSTTPNHGLGGRIRLTNSLYRLDHIRLFHANITGFQNSVNGTGEKGGVQVDKFEIYNYFPVEV